MPAPLFEPGWLQDKTLAICDGFVNGKVKLKEGKSLTPTVIAKLIQEKSGGKLAEPPSSGAVAAIFDRWADYGIAKFSTKPRAFVGWTRGKPDLAAIRTARSEKRKADRAAAAPPKPAKVAAKKAPAKAKATTAKKASAKKATTKAA